LIFYQPSSGRTAKIKGISEGSFYFANSNTGVVLDVNLLTQNRVIKFPDAAGTILLDTTLPAETDPIFLSQSGDYYTNNPLGYITGAALSGYLTGFTESDPVFMSYLATGFTYPGSDSYVPSTKAVADYIEAMALNLGDVITTGGFYISGASTARRTIDTGSRYRIEYATGLL
jgi:hypothetical protein